MIVVADGRYVRRFHAAVSRTVDPAQGTCHLGESVTPHAGDTILPVWTLSEARLLAEYGLYMGPRRAGGTYLLVALKGFAWEGIR